MPTTLELANIPIPDDVAFKSLIPVIKERKVTHQFMVHIRISSE